MLSRLAFGLRRIAAQSAPLASRARAFAAASHGLSEAEVKERVFNVVKAFQGVDAQKVTETAHFQKDLGLDSLSVVELVLAVEEEFAIEIPDDDADRIATVQQAINYIKSHPQAK